VRVRGETLRMGHSGRWGRFKESSEYSSHFRRDSSSSRHGKTESSEANLPIRGQRRTVWRHYTLHTRTRRAQTDSGAPIEVRRERTGSANTWHPQGTHHTVRTLPPSIYPPPRCPGLNSHRIGHFLGGILSDTQQTFSLAFHTYTPTNVERWSLMFK